MAWGTCPISKFWDPLNLISLYRLKLHSSNSVCTWILGYSCPQTRNWPPKWAWPGVRAHFRNFGTPSISLYRMKPHFSNLVRTWSLGCSCPQSTNWPRSGRGLQYVPNFDFLEQLWLWTRRGFASPQSALSSFNCVVADIPVLAYPGFHCATLYVSAVFALARCPSVCHVGALYPDG